MDEFRRAGYLAHARMPAFRNQYERAMKTVRYALSTSEHPYISLSCGKDSSAMAWMVLSVDPTVPMRVGVAPETRLLHSNFDVCLDWWRGAFPESVIHEVPYRLDDDGEDLHPLDEGLMKLWEALTVYAPFDTCFVGVRSQESKARRFSNRVFRDDPRYPIYTYKGDGPRKGTRRVVPLEYFSTTDVWAVLALNKIPVLAQYEGGENERTTLRLHPESLRDGVISKLRQREPEQYRKLVEKYPDLQRLT